MKKLVIVQKYINIKIVLFHLFKVPNLRNDRELLENDDAYSTGMRATEIIDNFLNDNIQEDFDIIREILVESETEDGSDIELDDLLFAI